MFLLTGCLLAAVILELHFQAVVLVPIVVASALVTFNCPAVGELIWYDVGAMIAGLADMLGS